MRRSLLLVAAAVVAAGCGDDTGDDTAEAAAGEVVVVESITDGDTFRTTDDERVRFIGIDTPELQGDECFADAATEHLAELIPPGSEVRLVLDVDPQDRFERTLAYVERADDGLDVGLAMARDGFALQLTVPPNVDRADAIGDAVANARDTGRGLWSAC